MEYLANIDGWQLRLIVNGAFQQNADAGNSGEDGKGHQHNAKPSALWRCLHGFDQVIERGIHPRKLIEDRRTTG
ncbi:hypothetical protein X742_05720 [Mesorhizobium sp. LNHC232B00]|nr:hypothetical protein X742_05720 [Mesorhizobium sp. LNHC232B00]